MVREAAVDTLLTVAGVDAVPVMEAHLQREKDTNVVFAILRGLKHAPCPKADAILFKNIKSSNEDLAVAALESLSKLKGSGLDKEPAGCLDDGRWRVRVAAMETVGELKLAALAGKLTKALDDPDAFVRSAAVETLPKLGAVRDVGKKLEEMFLRDDEIKPAVVIAMASLKLTMPDSFAEAMKTAKPETIIAVIEALGDSEEGGIGFAASFVDHADSDVACSAIRLLAAKRLEKDSACGVLAKVLQGSDREGILTTL